MRFDRRTMNTEREERARLREAAVRFNLDETRADFDELGEETGLPLNPKTERYSE